MGIEMDVGEWDRAGFCLGPGRLVVLCGRGDLSVLAMGVYGLDGPAWNGRSVARKGPGMGRERYSLLWGVGFGGWGIVAGWVRSIKSSRGEHTCHGSIANVCS